MALVILSRPAPAAAAPGNLAQGRPTTASSVENANFPAGLATDGNTGSRWSSVFADNQWVYVDLGATYTINKVVLNWEAAYGRTYQIQVSNNASAWTTIYTENNGNGGLDDLNVAGTGRYVRMNGLTRATPYGFSLFEFEVYGGSNVARNKATTVSSVENGNFPGALAVDGNTGSRWSSVFADNQWIYVDLGSAHTINRVVLNWEAAFGRTYQIQVSNNASSWTTIYTENNGNGAIDDLTIAGTGRYVRMNGLTRGTPYGFSLFEFEVYGQPAAGGWNLVWSDEFNSAAGTAPNSANWTMEVGGNGWGNNERQYYTNSTNNVAHDGQGNLVITARRENTATTPYTCHYGRCEYTSARLISSGKREFLYGRIEARLKLPYGQGIWPAFWMLGNNIGQVNWPTCGEIDIMENVGYAPGTLYGTVHGPGYSGAGGVGGNYTLPNGQRFADAFHVFAVEWEPNVIRWYVDGNLYFTVTPSQVSGTWVFDHPHFLLLNLAVGGNWPGNPDGTTVFPQTYHIDYVRVYQR
jgi:beta-glucanase (GH16 family)